MHEAPFCQNIAQIYVELFYCLYSEKLPTTSRDVADFDIQLQQSIVALEELNSDLIRDTAIIYSSANVPNPNDKDAVPPSLIRDDIVKWGYSWYVLHCMTGIYVQITLLVTSTLKTV